MNFANQVEADFLDDPAYGIDAALWIGTPGQTGLYAVSEILAGNVNPSGRLSTTFWRTHDQNPSLANFGTTVYEGAPDAVNSDGSPQQDKYYVVYQEGIYLGYRYTESRYEDFVMGTPNTGNYNYAATVSYPFGYGLSYTTFDYSGFRVEKDTSGAEPVYNVTVTVTNTGAVAGKETVQVYLQKPYGDYNKQYDVEAASAELVAFDKTDLLQPGQSQTLTIPVNERQFASYDAYNAGTFVLTRRRLLPDRGKECPRCRQQLPGKEGLYGREHPKPQWTPTAMRLWSATPIACVLDAETYSTSAATGAAIENQFS